MCDSTGRVLNVRKRGTTKLMLPGGKPRASETPEQTAIREFEEELGVALDARHLTSLGQFHANAANETDTTLIADVFEHPYLGGVRTCAEIDHLEWVDPLQNRDDLAPLTTEHVFPLLMSRPSTGN